MRPERVPLHSGDQLRFVVGADLETTVAVKYLSMKHSRGTLGRSCKMQESSRQEDG